MLFQQTVENGIYIYIPADTIRGAIVILALISLLVCWERKLKSRSPKN